MRTTCCALWLAALLSISCGSDDDSGSDGTLRGDYVSFNAEAATLADYMLDMQDDAVLGMAALNQGDYEGYDAFGKALPQQLGVAADLASDLHDTAKSIESRLNAASTSGTTTSVKQPLGPLSATLIALSIGAFAKWCADTYKAGNVVAEKKAAQERFVELRTQYYTARGEDALVARELAVRDSDQVLVHQALDTTQRMAVSLGTQGGKLLAEQALGTVSTTAAAVLHVKDAADTGTLIGESFCPSPDAPTPRASPCRIYFGRSQGGVFDDIDQGVWNLVATVDGYVPYPATQQALAPGSVTTVEPEETLNEVETGGSGGGTAGSGGSGGSGGTSGTGGVGGVGGTGGSGTGTCADFAAEVRALTGDPSAVTQPCEACLNDACGASCGACMAAGCVASFIPCTNGCGVALDACEAACDCTSDCTACQDACLDNLDACNASCESTPAGQLMVGVAACLDSQCAATCGVW
jgi:uncharacterized membrane protein YgcG